MTSFPREFVVVDTETTGMPPSARLVEIGALRVKGRNIVDRFETLVNPEAPIPEVVVRVHGITDAAVAEAPPASEILPKFLAWMGPLPLVAHNARFDASMLACECARLGISIPSNPVLCTLLAARKILQRPSHALEALVDDLGLPRGDHHRAASDAEHCLNLLQRMEEVADGALPAKLMGGGGPLSGFGPETPSLPLSLKALEEAALRDESVDLRYRLADGRVIDTRISPRWVFQSRGGPILEGLCHHALHYKHYRVDRILAAEACPEAPPVSARPVGA